MPVSLDLLGKGVPQRLALICLPNEEDIKEIRKKPNRILIKDEDNQLTFIVGKTW